MTIILQKLYKFTTTMQMAFLKCGALMLYMIYSSTHGIHRRIKWTIVKPCPSLAAVHTLTYLMFLVPC